MRCTVDPLIWESEQDALQSDSVLDEQRMGSDQQPLPIPSHSGIRSRLLEVLQARRITEQGAQHERRGGASPKGTHHELERVVNPGRHVTDWPRSEGASLREGCELQGYSSPPRPPAPLLEHGQPFTIAISARW